jgi:hypothetical protein
LHFEFWVSPAWQTIDFEHGTVSYGFSSDDDFVLCVRREELESGPFGTVVISGDRVVRDTATGLAWQGCIAGRSGDYCATGSASTLTWQAALAYCDGLSWGGFDDWRLPSRNELQSTFGYGGVTPAIDLTVFPEDPTGLTWSSSSQTTQGWNAYLVNPGDGRINTIGKENALYVRCVRQGP